MRIAMASHAVIRARTAAKHTSVVPLIVLLPSSDHRIDIVGYLDSRELAPLSRCFEMRHETLLKNFGDRGSSYSSVRWANEWIHRLASHSMAGWMDGWMDVLERDAPGGGIANAG